MWRCLLETIVRESLSWSCYTLNGNESDTHIQNAVRLIGLLLLKLEFSQLNENWTKYAKYWSNWDESNEPVEWTIDWKRAAAMRGSAHLRRIQTDIRNSMQSAYFYTIIQFTMTGYSVITFSTNSEKFYVCRLEKQYLIVTRQVL